MIHPETPPLPASAASPASAPSLGRKLRLILLLWWAHLWRTAVLMAVGNLVFLSLVALADRFGGGRYLFGAILRTAGYTLVTPALLGSAVLIEAAIVLASSAVAWRHLAGSSILRALIIEVRKATRAHATPQSEPRIVLATTIYAAEEPEEESVDESGRTLGAEAPSHSELSERDLLAGIEKLEAHRRAAGQAGRALWRAHCDDCRAPVLLLIAAVGAALYHDLIWAVELLAVIALPVSSLVALHSLTLPDDIRAVRLREPALLESEEAA